MLYRTWKFNYATIPIRGPLSLSKEPGLVECPNTLCALLVLSARWGHGVTTLGLFRQSLIGRRCTRTHVIAWGSFPRNPFMGSPRMPILCEFNLGPQRCRPAYGYMSTAGLFIYSP